MKTLCASCASTDSDGNPILTQAELGKLVRSSAKAHAQRNQQQHSAATRNLYNRQQPLQYDQSQYRQSRNYGSSGDSLNGFGPVMGAASNGRGASSEANDDDEGSSSLGPNFGANFDNNDNENDGEGSSANNEGQAMNLNQAASGYPAQDYNNDAGLFGFGPGYSTPDAEFSPNENYAGEGKRAKSASSHTRGLAGDEDAGAPQYGPNSAVNGDKDDDERSSYAPEGENDNDDE